MENKILKIFIALILLLGCDTAYAGINMSGRASSPINNGNSTPDERYEQGKITIAEIENQFNQMKFCADLYDGNLGMIKISTHEKGGLEEFTLFEIISASRTILYVIDRCCWTEFKDILKGKLASLASEITAFAKEEGLSTNVYTLLDALEEQIKTEKAVLRQLNHDIRYEKWKNGNLDSSSPVGANIRVGSEVE